MKTLISILTLLIVSVNLNAQVFTKNIKGNANIKTEKRSVSDYDKISVAGSFDVKLVKGKEGAISIIADENLMEYIETEVENGHLKIQPKKGYQLKATKTILITVPFEMIDAISLAGSGNVRSTDVLNAADLNLNLAGSGGMDLPVSIKNLKAQIAGSGNIKLSGNAEVLRCEIAGSGNLNGDGLKATASHINIAGSGNVNIHAVSEIHAKIVGSGDVIYTGNPGIEKLKSVGSGSIKKKS
ncbi:MAG: head GIN domain-containing protein [Lutibacter sp.]|nr:head GIN domain-containing protein [Lutibacter sp.]MDP3944326.1 head GIN domain-containing protein [Lutibacter sp.]